jgi:signal transduction histidine kinase
MNDIAEAIATLAQTLSTNDAAQRAPAFHLSVEGTPRDLPPIVHDEVYRIAGEALRNAFRHARASQIEVDIRYDQRRFRLRVRDDGKGIDAAAATGRTYEGPTAWLACTNARHWSVARCRSGARWTSAPRRS